MPGLGNLDSFLTDKERIVDFSWLDIDPCDYKNIPFDETPEYIAVPKLQEAWRHLEDNNINLVPNSDLNFNYKTPKAPEQDINDLLNYTKRQMMSGKQGSALVEAINKYASPEVIRSAFKYLSAFKDDYGLLGNVYVDPEVFAKCADGAKFLDKRAKTARYVKKMSKCDGCFFNNCGNCQIYKRAVASEIPYDGKTFSFYANHLSKVQNREVEIKSKDDLRRAFLHEINEPTRVADNKPIEQPDEKTLDQKKKEFEKQFEDLKKELDKIVKTSAAQDISTLLLKGYDARTIKSHITSKYSKEEFEANKEAINDVLSKQGSLGRMYVESDKLPYKNCFEAKDFFKQNAPGTKYMVVKKPFCKCFPHGKGMGQTCRNTNKVLIPSIKTIPRTEWFNELNKFPKGIVDKVSSIFEKDVVRGLRLAFLQNELLKNDKGPISFDTLSITKNLDNTSYNPAPERRSSFTSQKIANALNKGYPLSSIIGTGDSLGVSRDKVVSSVKKALEEIKKINRYQLDVPFKVPASVEVTGNQKDLNIELKQSVSEIPEFAVKSSEAPVDTLVKDLELKDAELDTKGLGKKKSDLEITGLSELSF